MKTITSRPDIRRITGLNTVQQQEVMLSVRNTLEPEHLALVNREIEMIAKEVIGCLSTSEKFFIHCGTTSYCNDLAEHIQRDYELPLVEHHITKIWIQAAAAFPIVGTEVHPCYPPNFANMCVARIKGLL